MKKILIIMVLLLFLVGCKTQEQQDGAADAESKVVGPTNIDIYEVPQERQSGVVIKQKTLADWTDELTKKADKIESLEYSYDGVYDAHIYVKGNKMKQVFDPQRTEDRVQFYNAVYMDADEKTAVGYCEGESCDYDEKKVVVSLEYDDFVAETPVNVINSIIKGAVQGKQMFDNKEVVVIERGLENGMTETIWVWIYYGIPLKTEKSIGGQRISRTTYLGMIVNGVKENDVVRIE